MLHISYIIIIIKSYTIEKLLKKTWKKLYYTFLNWLDIYRLFIVVRYIIISIIIIPIKKYRSIKLNNKFD